MDPHQNPRRSDDFHVHIHPPDTATRGDLLALQRLIMASLDQVIEQARANATVLESLNTLLDGLRTEVQEILSGARVPAATQAKIDAAFAQLTDHKTKLDEVVTENTPQAP